MSFEHDNKVNTLLLKCSHCTVDVDGSCSVHLISKGSS